jgi:lysylphosphatidylglycerol synthetase-like protein (DUF2156 family)
MAITILSSPLFMEMILPFLLIFTVVFAILQKTEILGKGKRQIDAIVALVIGLIVVAFGNAVGIINAFMPVLAVAIVVLLVFMIMFGMVFKEGEFKMPKGVQTAVGILAAIVVIVALLLFTGWWNYLYDLIFSGGGASAIVSNVVIIVIVIVAVAIVWWGGKGKEEKKDKE